MAGIETTSDVFLQQAEASRAFLENIVHTFGRTFVNPAILPLLDVAEPKTEPSNVIHVDFRGEQ